MLCITWAVPLCRFVAMVYHQLACWLQVGLAEMKNAVDRSGGLLVQTDTFLNAVFRESFKRIFAQPGEAGYLHTASNAVLEVGALEVVRACG